MNKDYYKGLYQIILKQFNGDATWSDVVDYREQNGVKTTYDYVQRGSAILCELLRAGYTLTPPNDEEANEENTLNRSSGETYNANDGTYTYDKLIEIAEGETITPELIMSRHNIDPTKWQVVTYKNNYWNSQAKEGRKIIMYQSKVVVKPLVKSELTFDDIEAYFDSKDFKSKPAVKPFNYTYDDTQESLEIDYTDSHLGLLSWRGETGEDYDIHIAEEAFKKTFEDILYRCKGHKYKLINFVTLGDILHIDNMSNTTTKGTPQDTDGRITKIFARAVDLMCECIDMLLELKCPIRYTYTAGNHDTFSGFALAKCLQKVYEKNPNIEFDISPNPRKACMYGNTLVGFCHGDMKQKNLSQWLLRDYRREYGECKFAEVHCGHLHSEAVKAENGILIKHLPATCGSSLWEHKEGYSSDRGVMCFVYHDTLGLRNNWYSYL